MDRFTKEQKDILAWAKNPTHNVVLSALAGTGKSTTIRESIKIWTGQNEKVLVVSFGKAIAENMNAKLAEIGVHGNTARTMHSLGLQVIKYNMKGVSVSPNKVYDTIMDMDRRGMFAEALWAEGSRSKELGKSTAFVVAKFIQAGRDEMIAAEDVESWEALAYDENFKYLYLVEQIMVALESEKWMRVIDFSDMIMYPLKYAMKVPSYLLEHKYLCVDEVQDWSRYERALAWMFKTPKTIVMAAGDRNQSIFSFKGAYVELWEEVIDDLEATVMPLSISFRCPSDVVRLAHNYVPTLLNTETAIRGSVGHMPREEFVRMVQPGDLVYARYTRYIVSTGLAVLREGKSVSIPGRKIAKPMQKALAPYEGMAISGATALIRQRVQQLNGQVNPKRHEQRELDMLETAYYVFYQGLASSVAELIQMLKRMTEKDYDREKDVLVQSIHQVKGGEANRCFYVNNGSHSMETAVQEWEVEEERRLQYVAITRAMKELWFVTDKPSIELLKYQQESQLITEGIK